MAEVDGFGNPAQISLHQSDPGAYHGDVSAFGPELLDKKEPGDLDRLLFMVSFFMAIKFGVDLTRDPCSANLNTPSLPWTHEKPWYSAV